MSTPRILLLGVLELIALIAIVRLWRKRRHGRPIIRLVWSVILLVPLFGILAYGFLTVDPDEHPDETDSMRDAAESAGEDGGLH